MTDAVADGTPGRQSDGRSDDGAAAVIAALGLMRHPEGGHYVETFRDPATDADGRPRSTAIFFLLAAGERSHWHRVDAVEGWHYHAGAPLRLSVVVPGAPVAEMILGADLAAGERPQGIVPAGAWQAAESLGAWTLVGCTVAPGFRFEGFELAPPDWEPPEPDLEMDLEPGLGPDLEEGLEPDLGPAAGEPGSDAGSGAAEPDASARADGATAPGSAAATA
jgi:predicted cupin superfamily sugar epimerase